MANVRITQLPELPNPAGNEWLAVDDVNDLDTSGKPTTKKIDINSIFGANGDIEGNLTIDKTVIIKGAPDRKLLFGVDEETASPGNTIFEFAGKKSEIPGLDWDVRFFLNDQETRVDTFNNLSAGEPRMVVAKFRGTLEEQLPVEIGDNCGTIEIAARMSDYPRAMMMIRTFITGEEAGGYMPTKTIFHNRKVGGASDVVPDKAGEIDDQNNLTWGTGTPSEYENFSEGTVNVKGANGGFAKICIPAQDGINFHDEFLLYSEDMNGERGDVFVYGNPSDGVLLRSGGAVLRVQGSTTFEGTSRVKVESGSEQKCVFQPTKMTTALRDAMTGLQSGDMIYNTTTNKHQGYNGTTWNDMY